MSKEAKSGRIARAARHAIEPLESRILLTVAGSPDWVEQGPGPLVGGQVLLPPNNPVAGAITSIAGDSFDLYVGTVGGGIWHTGDASVASPNWAPLTPQYPSLAITALAVDPADSAVVWAGTGKASSSGMGGKTIGLMRSSDHGRTWRVFDARLGSAGRTVNAILPMTVNGDNGRVVLVGSTATRFGKGRNQLGGGLLRSSDSVNGAFMKISGNANDGIDNDGDGKIDQDDLDVNKWGWLGEDTGLPAGTVTDLEVDPTFPRRVYAAVAGQGVFRSDDTGLTWRNVSAGLPNVGMAARIELSVGGAPPNGSPSVYAALLSPMVDFLQAAANAGTNQITVAADAPFEVDDRVTLDPGTANAEGFRVTRLVRGGGGTTLTLDVDPKLPAGTLNLTNNHGARGVVSRSGASWSSTLSTAVTQGATELVIANRQFFNEGELISIANAGVLETNVTVRRVIPGAGTTATLQLSARLATAAGFPANSIVTTTAQGDVSLRGVYRATNLSVVDATTAPNWAAMQLPQTTEQINFDANRDGIPQINVNEVITQTYGLNPGRQGDIHFAIAADPTSPNIVFVAGDTQPTNTERDLNLDGDKTDVDVTIGGVATTLDEVYNSAGFTGDRGWAGRILSGDVMAATQWRQIVGRTANNTAPHSDTRAMAFVGGTLIVADDGGLSRFNAATARWQSMNGNLGLTELLSVAYDADTNQLIGGAQDVGVGVQVATSKTWNVPNDSTGSPSVGDGGIVQVGQVLGAGGADRSFYSSQKLLGFSMEAGGVITAPALNIAGVAPPTSLRAYDTVQFVQPFVVNSIPATSAAAPTPLLFGTNFLYESTAGTATGSSLILLGVRGGNANPPAGNTPPAAAGIGTITALVYGGLAVGTPPVAQPDLIVVGSNGSSNNRDPLYIRQPNAGANMNLPVQPVVTWRRVVKRPVQAVAVDPVDWRRIFVLDDLGRIWFTADGNRNPALPTGANAWRWTQLNNNLKNLPGARKLQSLAVYTPPAGGATVVLVGGEGGLFRRIGVAGKELWTEYGGGATDATILPNTVVTDIRYNIADDVLVVGTLGRGAWSIPNANATLATPGTLTLTSLPAVALNEVFEIERNPSRPWMLDAYYYGAGGTRPATPTESVPLASLQGITLEGLAGDDKFIINYTNGPIWVPGGITVDGGPGTNTLIIRKGGVDSSVGSASGKTRVTGRDSFFQSGTQQVTWSNITPSQNPKVALAPLADTVGDGLAALGDGLQDGLANAARDKSTAGLDTQSVVAGMGGARLSRVRPRDQKLASEVPSAPESEEAGGEDREELESERDGNDLVPILRRLIEEDTGGFDFAEIASDGLYADPASIEVALEALDDDPNNVSLDTTSDSPTDADSDPDVLFDVRISKHLDGQAFLDVAADVLGGAARVELLGNVEVEALVDLHVRFGVDADGFFVLPSINGDPAVRLSRFEISGDVSGGGRLGFLGVDLEQATLTVDPGAHVNFFLRDPGTDAEDDAIRIHELTPDDLGALVSVDIEGNPGGPDDVVLDGAFSATAVFGDDEAAGIPLLDADVELRWPDLTNPSNLTVQAAPGSTGAKVLDFLKVTGAQVVDQLKAVRGYLDTLSKGPMHIDLSVVQDVLDDVMKVVDFIDREIVNPLQAGGGVGVAVPTIQELVETLSSQLGIPDDTLAYDVASGDLTYHVDLSESLLSAASPAGLHFELPVGLSLETSATAAADGQFDLDFIFGINIKNIAAGGAIQDNVFLKDASMGAGVTVNIADLDVAARMGFLELSTSNGIANATANVSLALKDPNSTSTRLTMRALGTAITARPLDLLVGKAPTLSGSAAIDLRNIAVNGLPGISPAPGAHVSLGIADLRAPTNVTADVVGFDNLFDFNNINATDVLSALTALCDYLGSLKDSPFISAKVPFTSKTLADVVDFKKAIAEGLLDALKDPEGKPVARTAQALADKLSQVLGLPAGTINARFDSAAKVLTFHVLLQKALGPVQAPIQVSGNLGDVAVLNADTTLSLDGGVSLDFVFGADISRRTVTITATADAPVNGRITADAHFKLKVGADAPVDVTVRGAATTANNTVDDLVSDITDALATAGLAGTVAAGRSGNKLTFSTKPTLARPRITLNATATDPAVTQLRFADGAAATDDIASRFFISNASVSGNVAAAASNIHLGAKLGFIDIGVDNGSANLNAAVSLQLQPPGGPAGGKVTIPQLTSAILSSPGSVVASPAVTGSARMDLPIVVEGGVLGTIVGTPQLAVRWTDITDPNTLTATFNADAGPLLDFKTLSFADVLNALKGIATYFAQLKSFSFLNQKLPLLNKSVTDLIDFVSDFAAKVQAFEQDPAGSLQELALKLSQALGLPRNSIVMGIDGKVLKIGFDLSKSVNVSRAVDLDLAALVNDLPASDPVRGFLQGISSVLDVQGSANLALSADALVHLNLGLDFTTPTSPRPFVYNNTGITLGAKSSGTNLNFTTALGPLGVFIKGGSASIDGDGNVNTTNDKAVFSVTLKGDPAGRTYLSDLGTDDVNVGLTGQVKATLPLYFPTQSNSIGNLALSITSLSDIPGTLTLTAPDLGAQASALNLVNNLGLVIDGLDILLSGIQAGLNSSVFSHKLPLIGDSFSHAGQFIQDFRARVISDLHAALDGAGDKAVGLVQDGIFSALGPAGLKLLQDVNNDGAVTRDDVPAVFKDIDGNGAVDQVQFDLKLHQGFSLINTPIDFDAALPGLGLEIDGDVQAKLSFDYALSFGVSSNPAIGFYLDTSKANELSVQLQAGIPGLHAKGKLGPLILDATDSTTAPSNLTANFAVDLLDPQKPNGPPPDNKLTYDEVTSGLDLTKLATARLAADANLNLGLVLGFGSGANFPSFASDFELKWHFDPADNMQGAVPTVAFKNVRMDLGSFVGSFVGPVLGKVRDITAPLQPVLDFINKPIPVLSDLMGKPTTVLDLATSASAVASFGNSSPADIRFITALAGVTSLLGSVPTLPSNTFVPLGSFDLAGFDVRGAADLSGATPNVTDQKDPQAAIQQSGAKDFFNATKNVGGSGSGLSFPILSHPSDAFKLLMGQDVDLVTYDMAPLSLGFEYGQSFGPFPIGPLPIAVTIRLGAAFNAFANLSFGFDTSGIRTAVETGNPADAFGGFYVKHKQGVPEVGISGSIFAGAEAGVVVVDFGLKGEVKASLSAGLRDVDKDGKVYLDEFVSNLEHGLLCTFDVTGKVTAGLSAYVTVGVWPFAHTTDWKIAEITLVDWQLSHEDCYSTRLEPNDLSAMAADIGVGPGIHLDNLALASPTDQDWYKFTVLRPVDSINVQSIFKNAAGNIDMDVVGADGRLLGRGASNKDRELVTLQNVQPGTYFVHVYGHAPETQPNNYKLFIDPGPGSKTRVFYVGNATSANQYYTLGKGDDANDGANFTRPKATLASLLAAQDLGPDDIVLFDTGTYAGGATILAEDGGALYAASPEGSTLTGPGTRIALNDSSGSLFYNLTFGGTGGVGIDIMGDGASDAKDNVVVNSTFKVQSGTGINVGSNEANLIRDNKFVGSATGISLAARATATVEGNDISQAATGISVESTGAQITGNVIHHNGAGVAVNGRGVFGASGLAAANDIHHNTTGVNVFSTATNAVVRFNKVHDNTTGVSTSGTVSSIFGNEIYKNTTGLTGTGALGPADWSSNPNDIHDNATGVSASASSDTVTTVVHYNRIHANDTGVRLANGAVAQNNLIYRNTGRGLLISGASGTRVTNNTIYEPTADGIHVSGAASNTRLRNNIVWTQAGYALRVELDSQVGFDSDYNDLFTSGAGKIGWWQKDFTDLYGWMVEVNSDNHSIGYTPVDPTLDDPKLINVAADDFRVTDLVSTGIDSGDPAAAFDLELVPSGARVDLGAYGNTPQSAKAPASYIRLDAPNFYDDWEADQGHTIKWHTHNVAGNVTIELYTAAGTKVATLGTAPAAQGSFQWKPGDSGIVGDSAKRYRIRISAGPVVGQSREAFAVPAPGGEFYLNDSSTAGDAYTTAAGNLRGTGKTPADPKTVLIGLMRDYDLGPGDTVHADTGNYLHVRDVILSGNVAINDDEGIAIVGPTDPSEVAAFDRGGVAGGLPLSLNDGDFVTLSHLTLTGGQVGVWVRNASVHFTGSYLTTSGNTLDGIRLESDATDSALDHLVSSNNGRDGIYVAAPIGSLTDSVAHHNTGAGIRLVNVGAARVQRNEVYNNAVGIDVQSPYNVPQTLIGSTDLAAGLGNKVHDNRAAGISASGSILIAGNAVYGQTAANQAGIVASASAQVLDNTVFGNFDGVQAGYNAGPIANNRFYNNRRYGISANQATTTVSGNAIYSNGGGIFAASSTLTVANNVIYANQDFGLSFTSAGTNTQVRNNTVFQETGDAVRVANGYSGIALRNNILWTGGGYDLSVTKESQSNLVSDYNLFYVTGTGKVGFWQNGERNTFASWRGASFLDAHSLFANPLFVNVFGGDFHERSTAGSFHGGSLAPVLDGSSGLPVFLAGSFLADGVNSPALDRGRPSDPFDNEPAPNGAFINLGAYGNTVQASKSFIPYVVVTTPDGGETLPGNQTFNIEWRAESYTGTVNIELLHFGSPAVVVVVADHVPNSGSYAWKVPATLAAADDYVLRVTRNEATPLSDDSNAPFSVVPPIRAYYVNDSTFAAGDWTTAPGDDANDGLSPAAPKASIRAVLEAYQLSAGDVVKVDAGRYPLTANVVITAEDAGVKVEGYHDNAFPGRVALLDRGGSTTTGVNAIELRGASGVTIDHLSVTGAYAGISLTTGLAGTDVTISNNTVFGNYSLGIFVGTSNDRVSILNNTLFGFLAGGSFDNQVTCIDVASADGTISGNKVYDYQVTGIYAHGARLNVTGNTVYRGGIGTFGISGTGIVASGAANTNPTVVSGNTVFDNAAGGITASANVLISDNLVYGQTGSEGIQTTDAGVRVENNTVFGNLDGIATGFGAPVITGNRVYNNSRYGIVGTNSSATYRGNTIYSNATGIGAQGFSGLIINNLMYANRTGGVLLTGSGTGRILNNTIYQPTGDAINVNIPTNVVVQNNIIQVNGGYALNVSPTSQPTFRSDYNMIYLTGAGKAALWNNVAQPTLADYQNASAQDLHSIGDDPRFNNLSGGDGVLGYASGTTGPAQILDDGAATLVGTWQQGTGKGFGGSYRFVPTTSTGANATWTFTGLVSGATYFVAGTWPSVGGASTVYYTLADGDRVLSSRPLAQSSLPNDFTDAGVPWESIGTVTIGGSSLSVTLSYPTASGLTADAVRIIRVTGDGGADDDFHVQPSSPTVDRGHPLSDFYAEPLPNGGRVNQGFDANTTEAQTSPAQLVQVLSPNGGEKLNSNESVTLTWRSSGLTASRPVLLIDSGGGGVDNFVADEFFTRQNTLSFANAVDLSGVTDPVPMSVYQSYDIAAGAVGSAMTYQLPVPDGAYTLRLHFAEPTRTAGIRQFDIRVNGATVRSGLDIAAVAGGPLKALALTFPAVASGGTGVKVELVTANPRNEGAIISGLELFAANPNGVASPTTDVELSTNNGTTWAPVATGVALDRFGRGSFTWTPDAATSGFTGLLRVRSNDGSRPQDVSDKPFLIAPTGHDYYVNDAGTDGDVFTTAPGDDANDGKNPGRPMASISAILDQYHLGPGDVIHVDTGVYNLSRNVTITADDGGIVVQGPGGNTAIIDRKGVTGYGFELRGATDVTLDHLAITGGRYGVWATAGSNNFTLSNSTLYANDERGVDVDGSDFATITGNTFYGLAGAATDQNNSVDVNAAHATIADNVVHNSAIGINVVSGGVTGALITVADNTVYSNGTGIEAFQSILVARNTVYGNVGAGIDLSRSSRAVDNVVYGNLDGIHEVANGSVVSGNRIFHNSRTGLIADGDVPITGNTVYSNAQGISVSTYAGTIANNLVYGNTTYGISLAGTGIAGYPPANLLNNTVYATTGDAAVVTPANFIRVRNNILWAVNGSDLKVIGGNGVNFGSDYNTLIKGSGPLARVATFGGGAVLTLVDWRAEVQDLHSSGADPMFVDFDGPDNLLGYSGGADHGGDDNFHVLPASPTIDAGDPLSYYLAEPAPNGGRANVGHDGNTPLAQASPAQMMQVTSPNGGERMVTGQPVSITFRSAGLTPLRPVALINAGGGVVGSFAADGYATGGTPRATGRAVSLTGVIDPAPAAVYDSYSSAPGGAGPLTYGLPVPDGAYTLRLHFVEPSFAAGTRKMEIRLNGTLVKENFDIAAAAGGIGKALVLEFPVTASGGAGIGLELVARVTPGFPAIVSGIEVLAADPGGVTAPAADVEASTNNGLSWMPIAAGVPLDRFGNGSVTWTPGPATTGATALVRVSTAAGSRPQDVSDRPFFVPPAGRDYYVNDASTAGDVFTSAAGSNANDGRAPSRPMASLFALLSGYDLGPGDVVHVDTGTYRLLRNITVSANDAGVRIEGPTSAVALFDRGSNATNAEAIEINGAPGVTVDHVSVTGAYTGISVGAGSNNVVVSNNTVHANDNRGIFIDAGVDAATVSGNTLYGVSGVESTNQNTGIWVVGTHALVTGNVVHDSAGQGIQFDAISGRIIDNEVFRSNTGIMIARGGTETITVSGNVVHNNRQHGISSDFGPRLISGNTVFGNAQVGIVTTANQVRDNVVYGNQDGIVAYFAGTAAVVAGNRVFNNSRYGLQNGDGANTFDGNLSYQNSVGFRANAFGGLLTNNAIHSNTNQGVLITASNGARVYNNTIYQPVGDAVAVSTTSSNVKVRNNILWTLAGSDLNIAADSRTGFASDYNDLFRGTGVSANVGSWNGVAQGTLAAWQTASLQDAHSLSADPKFLDLDGSDNVLGYTNNGGGYDGGADDNFQLAAGSPLIDHGDDSVAPAKDLLGAGRADDPGTPNGTAGFSDMGAFEFLGDTGDTTPPTVAGTTPAAIHSGGGLNDALAQITLTFSEPVNAIDAAAPASYEFRGAGPDGAFDTGDDVVYSLTPHFTVGSRDVRIDIVGGTRSTGLYRLTVHGQLGRGVRDLSGVLLDGDGNGTAGGDYVRQFTVTHKSTVLARQLFYNNSSFDHSSPAANADDDGAIAGDKAALLPGQAATFRSYSGYDKGINGIMIDMKELPAGGTLTADDFIFKVGNGGDPASWLAGPTPAGIVIRRGAGTGGSDRVTITFPDRSIVNQWLQVTVKATATTKLAAPDVFYFGSLIGDTGDTFSPLRVSAMDVIALRRATSAASVPLTSPFDLNRDGKINALDLSALRTNLSRTLRPLIAPAAPQAAIAAIAPGPSQGTESAIRRVWEEPISDPLGRSQ